MGTRSTGHCYMCGTELGKVTMKNHLLKKHQAHDGQLCYLLKIEGLYDKDYWLYVDMPLDKSFSTLDTFLRKIWLECCGHLSAFRGGERGTVGKSRKLGDFSVGDKFIHEYDFGSTTETLITIVTETERVAQRQAVRLLARNTPQEFTCASCGETADMVCCECILKTGDAYYCDKCAGEHEQNNHNFLLPITNSPRMGVCGYDGVLDDYTFYPVR